jgi:hypothetical protein
MAEKNRMIKQKQDEIYNCQQQLLHLKIKDEGNPSESEKITSPYEIQNDQAKSKDQAQIPNESKELFTPLTLTESKRQKIYCINYILG